MTEDMTFSPLGGLYLDHIDDIRAGAAAFRADVAELLGLIADDARQSGPGSVEVTGDGVTKTMSSQRGIMPVVLRLRWGEAWPTFTASDMAKDVPLAPAPLKDLFPSEFLGGLVLPEVDRQTLRRTARTHLRTKWSDAESAVAEFVNRPAFREREAAVRLMLAVSTQIFQSLRTSPIADTAMDQVPGQTKADGRFFPCFVQWFLTSKDKRRRIPCDLTYMPSAPAGGAPASLKLILWDAGGIPAVVQMSLPERVEKAPVVGDFSGLLNAYLDRVDLLGDAEVVEIAAEVSSAVLSRYEAVVRRVHG